MPEIKPFRGLRPTIDAAQRLMALPYDVLTSEEARLAAKGNPYSFLHVSKPEIDLPRGLSVYDPAVYAKGRENFAQLVREGLLQQEGTPCFYAYRLQSGEHVQTGVVVTASLADYQTNRIRKHELTRPDKEDDRVRHMEALNAQTGPVLLVYPDHSRASELIRGCAGGPPVYDALSLNGVEHSLWVIDDVATIAELERVFAEITVCYIADGHHRSAAAARVAERRGYKDVAANRFLAVMFPVSEVRILDYNRVVKDLHGLSPAEFIERVSRLFSMKCEDLPVRPSAPGEFGMYVDGQWYRLSADPKWSAGRDPVARLDVSILTDRLLQPVLGIEDVRRDPRIEFVGGVRGVDVLQARVDGGEIAVAFSIFPTPMSALIAVADAGKFMPPKSTWFEPKLADGLVSYLLGGQAAFAPHAVPLP